MPHAGQLEKSARATARISLGSAASHTIPLAAPHALDLFRKPLFALRMLLRECEILLLGTARRIAGKSSARADDARVQRPRAGDGAGAEDSVAGSVERKVRAEVRAARDHPPSDGRAAAAAAIVGTSLDELGGQSEMVAILGESWGSM